MRTYDVNVLKKMIENNQHNIKMLQKSLMGYLNCDYPERGEYLYDRIANLAIANRKLGALIENNGEYMDGVDVDVMQYSATAGADTSWWG